MTGVEVVTRSPFAAAAAKAALVSKSIGLEIRLRDEAAREMLDETAAEEEFIVSIRTSDLGKVTMGVVSAKGLPAVVLQRTTRGKLSVMTEVTAGLEGA